MVTVAVADMEFRLESVAVRVIVWLPGIKVTLRGEPVPSKP